MPLTRRQLIASAAAIGASYAWGGSRALRSTAAWTEVRTRFPEGVASGDPQADSVILWTRCPATTDRPKPEVMVEVAEDRAFKRLVTRAGTKMSGDSDWTCRVLVGGLKAGREYWYRFIDANGEGSRLGRTVTAPAPNDARTVRFAFVSCQNCNDGAQNAYRRMIFEDEKAPPDQRLDFVMHLGDWFYELVWYPEDRPEGMYDRQFRDILRYPTGEKIDDFHVPTDLADYRTIYRAYLRDIDIQDARARWPFVCMGDNHEFSWKGWQSQQDFGGLRPAQTRKVAANQAWFEFQPSRVKQPSGGLDQFVAPVVKNAPIEEFDDHGLGLQADNLAAIGSMTTYRALRFGRNVELILTDNRTYRSRDLANRPEMKGFFSKDFPLMLAEEALDILDAGSAYGQGQPPPQIAFGDQQLRNFRQHEPPQSMLGKTQKAWFLNQLTGSTATWKLWGNSVGATDVRADLHNLPLVGGPKWLGAGYGIIANDDWGGYRFERAQILDHIRDKQITGFASLAGDRHSFYAGWLAASLPPKPFVPVGIEFVTGSISAPTLAEAFDHSMTPDKPWAAIYRQTSTPGQPGRAAINLTARRGVKASLAMQRGLDPAAIAAATNPEVAPNLDFMDCGGHGYVVIAAHEAFLDAELVCLPRPIERAVAADGGPLRYRVSYRSPIWKPGETPILRRTAAEGELPLGS
ncbi:MAG TPA: alkaline phosphatase D family protein [Steroidobacteraceae bacterium]|nr:alkaline phosphatase D family protein [Steroidobacteraceae bacterium]